MASALKSITTLLMLNSLVIVTAILRHLLNIHWMNENIKLNLRWWNHPLNWNTIGGPVLLKRNTFLREKEKQGKKVKNINLCIEIFISWMQSRLKPLPEHTVLLCCSGSCDAGHLCLQWAEFRLPNKTTSEHTELWPTWQDLHID